MIKYWKKVLTLFILTLNLGVCQMALAEDVTEDDTDTSDETCSVCAVPESD